MRHIIFGVDYFLIFAAIFIADKTIFGLSLFYPIWLCVLIRRTKFTKIELFSQVLLLLFYPLLMRGAYSSVDIEYYNFYFQALGFINVIVFITEFIQKYSKKKIIVASIGLLILFSIGTMLFTILTGGRGRFIFGPNVTYRVISLFFGFVLVCYYNQKYKILNIDKWLILSCVTFTLGMFFTGSRGALVVVILYFALMLIISYRQPKVMLSTALLFLVLIGVVFYYWDFFEVYFHRIIYFNLDNNSESYRFDKWKELSNFMENKNFYFGLTEENNLINYYPHNILLELIFYFGIYSGLAFFIGCVFYALSFMKNINLNILMLGVLFGSMVSGNLQYNYMVLSILSYSTVLSLNLLGNNIGKKN